MRSLAIACGLLLAACSAPAFAQSASAPQARLSYGDLNLRDPAHRQVLVARVDQAVAAYCREHGDLVTPTRRRNDPRYCRATMRAQLKWAMPMQVRRAYDHGWERRPVRRMPT